MAEQSALLSMASGRTHWLWPTCIEEAHAQIYKEWLNEEEQKVYLEMNQETVIDYKEMFEIFDDNSDGTIKTEELMKVMHMLDEVPNEAKLNEWIAKADFNGDGVIDFDEFMCIMIKS